jgi:hypothetical protein
MIVNFTIENDGEMFIVHRLSSPGNIQDSQPVMMEYQVVFCKSSLLVWPPVKEIFGKQGNIKRVIDGSGNAAHGYQVFL